MTETTTKQLWICESCGFIYDPAEGEPDGGIPPGTPVDDIPDTWCVPGCGARKKAFIPYEITAARSRRGGKRRVGGGRDSRGGDLAEPAQLARRDRQRRHQHDRVA